MEQVEDINYPETVDADFAPFKVELADTEDKLQELEVTLESLESLRAELTKNGASRRLALGIESLVPGSLDAKYPVISFTEVPGRTNLRIAEEGIGSGILTTINNMIRLIFRTLRKAVTWTINLLKNTRDSEKAVAIAGAQATTSSNAAADMASKLDAEAKGKLEELIQSALVEPIKDSAKALTDYLLNPEYTDQDIADLKEGLYLICDEVNDVKASAWIFDQLLGKFRTVLEAYYKNGVISHDDTWAPSENFLEGFARAAAKLTDGQYVFNLARPNAHKFNIGRSLSNGFYDVKRGVDELNSVLTKLIDSPVKNDTVGWFKAENWLNPFFVQNFATKVMKATAAIYLDKDITTYLSTIDARVDELERLSAIGIGDFASEEAQGFLTKLKDSLGDFNDTVHKLLEILALLRRQQDSLISTLRVVERGQARVIAEITKLAPDELSQELRKTFNIHKTAHAAVRDLLLAQKLNANAA